MPAPASPDQLLARSVIVTGTHYSMTTLVGALLATAPEFHLLHEPLNPQPTRSYDSIQPPRWYEYYPPERIDELRDALVLLFERSAIPGQFLKRLGGARSAHEVARAVRYAQRRGGFWLSPKPVVLKDPFLAFTARTLQQELGLKTILTVRHPAGFAESFVRKAGRFDFSDLAAQPALLDALSQEADALRRFARNEQPPLKQAALLWRVVYGFAAQYLLPNARTLMVRQEDLVAEPETTAAALLQFAGASETSRTRSFLSANLQTGSGDHAGGSYIRRDGNEATHKWRSRLSAEDIATIRTMAGELAERYGYTSEDWAH